MRTCHPAPCLPVSFPLQDWRDIDLAIELQVGGWVGGWVALPGSCSLPETSGSSLPSPPLLTSPRSPPPPPPGTTPQVDFIALSFVKSADAIKNLKR